MLRALAVLLVCAAPARAAVSFGFERRVELLGVLERLARPVPEDSSAYAAAAARRFAAFAGHPAVAAVRAVPEEERSRLVEWFLAGGNVPLMKESEEFARDAGFDRFWAETARERGRLEAAARAEAAGGLSPESLADYLRLEDRAEHRFVLAPLLPRSMAANRPPLRVRVPDRAKAAPWGFGEFGSGSAHEAAHDLLDPLAPADIPESSPLMFAGCTATWRGCIMEEIVVAVTSRALALERGEEASAATRREYAGKYRHVPALVERLREWETGRGTDFSAFYPRLLAVFDEEGAKAAAAAPAPPRRRRPR